MSTTQPTGSVAYNLVMGALAEGNLTTKEIVLLTWIVCIGWHCSNKDKTAVIDILQHPADMTVEKVLYIQQFLPLLKLVFEAVVGPKGPSYELFMGNFLSVDR